MRNHRQLMRRLRTIRLIKSPQSRFTTRSVHPFPMTINKLRIQGAAVALATFLVPSLHASEADIKIPDLTQVRFDGLGGLSGLTLMYLGILVCFVGAIFGLLQYKQTKALPV